MPHTLGPSLLSSRGPRGAFFPWRGCRSFSRWEKQRAWLAEELARAILQNGLGFFFGLGWRVYSWAGGPRKFQSLQQVLAGILKQQQQLMQQKQRFSHPDVLTVFNYSVANAQVTPSNFSPSTWQASSNFFFDHKGGVEGATFHPKLETLFIFGKG